MVYIEALDDLAPVALRLQIPSDLLGQLQGRECGQRNSLRQLYIRPLCCSQSKGLIKGLYRHQAGTGLRVRSHGFIFTSERKI